MKARLFPLVFVALALTLVSSACGMKGPPVPPAPSFTAAARQVSARVENGFVVLEGETYGKAHDLETLSGCRVEYAWYAPGEEPCRGCPLEFRPVKNVEAVVAGPEGVSCRVPWSGDQGVHYYRLRLTGPTGTSGPPSEPASVEAGERESQEKSGD